jgi:pyrroloquinoline quinone (PQQ) biosynthesis protein C
MNAEAYIQSLEKEISQHEAVQHPFLLRFASEKLTMTQIQTFGLQHYQLVRVFLNYMTNLLPKIPDLDAANLFRTVFEDEFGQHTIFRSHPALYRNFLKATGLQDEDWGRVPLLPETTSYIEDHLKLTRDAHFIVGLGIVGPGHEFSIPTMFGYIVRGLKQSTALTDEQIEYFSCHIEQDIGHAKVFNQLLVRHVETEEGQAFLRDGAMKSLALRKRFWDGLHRVVFSA